MMDIEELRKAIEEDLREQMPGWSDSAVAELVEITIEMRGES